MNSNQIKGLGDKKSAIALLRFVENGAVFLLLLPYKLRKHSQPGLSERDNYPHSPPFAPFATAYDLSHQRRKAKDNKMLRMKLDY
jgi:hypothetical protein